MLSDYCRSELPEWTQKTGGRYWIRTSDPFGVNEVLYH